MYTYTFTQWMLLFFTYSFFGWCIESTIVSVKERHLVNRGFLRIPMLPLYGSGAVLILFLTIPVQDSLVSVYLVGALGATVLEYITGWGMEQLFKIKYWDYSSQKLQLHGRICLSSSLFWGVLSVALTEYIHPPIGRLILGLPAAVVTACSITFFFIMLADTIVSAKAALDLARILERLSHTRDEMEQLHLQLDGLRESAQQELDAAKKAAQQEISAARESAQQHIIGVKEGIKEKQERMEELLHEPSEKIRSRLRELSAMRENEMSHLGFIKSQLLKGHPSAYSKRFNDTLRELKEYLKG